MKKKKKRQGATNTDKNIDLDELIGIGNIRQMERINHISQNKTGFPEIRKLQGDYFTVKVAGYPPYQQLAGF